MTGAWRPCCGTCRSEKIGVVAPCGLHHPGLCADCWALPSEQPTATGLRCADCQTEWDGSELTDEEAAARPKPPWLPKMYEG